ncbi:MAG: 50S ribosomal protein L22 [Planctomycetes bacterium]|nr:50S ribosomal protein L22 [Planctomycetota bacterium]
MDYKAKHRFADVGPRKIRLFANLIRGKNVDEALQLLRFYPNRGAKLLLAVVESAYGNADHLECPDPDGLVVSECRVDGAPTFKRIQPRARGTAFQIKRRMAHIIVTLSEPPEEAPELTTDEGAIANAPVAPAPTGSEPAPVAPPTAEAPAGTPPAPTPPTSGA